MPLLIANCQSTTWSTVSVVICHFVFVRALITKRPNDRMCNNWRCWRIWKLGESLQAHFIFFAFSCWSIDWQGMYCQRNPRNHNAIRPFHAIISFGEKDSVLDYSSAYRDFANNCTVCGAKVWWVCVFASNIMWIYWSWSTVERAISLLIVCLHPTQYSAHMFLISLLFRQRNISTIN